MTNEQKSENVRAYAKLLEPEGWREVQFYDNGEWLPFIDMGWRISPDTLLRVRPVAKLRAWNMTEVPIGAFVRSKNGSFRGIITAATTEWVYIYSSHSFKDLLSRFEYSTDGGKNWKPCGVMEGEG